MTDKFIGAMTRKEFDTIPLRKYGENIGPFRALVILPTRKIHDSGYRCMDFVAVRDGKAIYRLSGCSDVLHIEGIGGYGLNWMETYGAVPDRVPPVGWSIDCLPKSGLLCLSSEKDMIAGTALSSFEVYSVGHSTPPKKARTCKKNARTTKKT